METVIVGMDDGLPYRAVLDGDTGLVDVPERLTAQWPEAGEMVMPGPVTAGVRFDPADPRAVYAWLTGATSVITATGPDLTTPQPVVEGVVH